MTEAQTQEPGDLPPTATAVTEDLREANLVASQANAVTAVYGLSGAGKSGLADTAAVYAAKTFGVTTLCYAADLGGWGNKRLALIRSGVLRVWDPRNHINPFNTMEMISLGAWPERMIDAERGYAAPDVKLVLPRLIRYAPICANGHVAATFDEAASAASVNVACPQCGVQVTATTVARVAKSIVKPALFKNVGFRIFDSLTALSDWGLLQELPKMSAENALPRNDKGGSLLGSAIALESGGMAFGSGSMAQVGFMQNRAYVWLSNIRSIADQVVPSVVIFGVEKSKSDDESGGETVLGPKIAGNARTSSVPGWVGNCLHASKEPINDAPNAPLVYRLWLTNHIDPRDPRKIPYLAKHRGTPDGMPDYLEDPVPSAPGDASKAWTVFSLEKFFTMLHEQQQREERRLAEELGGVLGKIHATSADAADEIVGEVQEITRAPQTVRGPIAGARPVAGGGAVAGRPVAGAVVAKPVVTAAPVVHAPAETPVSATATTTPVSRPVAGRPVLGAPAPVAPPVVATPVVPAPPVAPPPATTTTTPRVARPIARSAPRPPV